MVIRPASDQQQRRIDLVRALAHPIRERIFNELSAAAPGATLAPKAFADRIGREVRTVAYHFKRLERLGVLAVVKRTTHRGAYQSHYALAPLGSADAVAQLQRLAAGVMRSQASGGDAVVVIREVPLDAMGVRTFIDKTSTLLATLAAETVSRSGQPRPLTIGLVASREGAS